MHPSEIFTFFYNIKKLKKKKKLTNTDINVDMYNLANMGLEWEPLAKARCYTR